MFSFKNVNYRRRKFFFYLGLMALAVEVPSLISLFTFLRSEEIAIVENVKREGLRRCGGGKTQTRKTRRHTHTGGFDQCR